MINIVIITNKAAAEVVQKFNKYVYENVNLVVVQTVSTPNENNFMVVKDSYKFNEGQIIQGEFYYNTPTFDFGNARNYAKMLILPYGGWVLSLDDDDDIEIKNGLIQTFFNDIIEKLNNSNIDAYYVNYKMFVGNFNQFDTKAIRIFKNNPAILWRDNIHETVDCSLTFHNFTVGKAEEPIFTILHDGYKDVKQLLFKAKRNIECYLTNPYLLDRYEHLQKFIDTIKRKKDLENQFNYNDGNRENVEFENKLGYTDK